MLDAFAAAHGFKAQVETVVTQRGLVVRLLTDNVLFDSGLADLKPQGLPLLGEVGTLLGVDRVHPIVVEGHTDDVPIATSKFASNWELSTARAVRGRALADRPQRAGETLLRRRLRRPAPARLERHRRRPRAQPPRRDRARSASTTCRKAPTP